MNFEEKENSLYLDNQNIPVHSNFLVSVVDSISPKEDKEKMFIGSIEDKKINFNYTKLKDNTFSTYTKNWGEFSLIKDIVPPTIKITKSRTRSEAITTRLVTAPPTNLSTPPVTL